MKTSSAEPVDFSDIPDPAARVRERPVPPAPAPATPALTRDQRNRYIVLASALGGAWVAVGTLRFGLRPDVSHLDVVLLAVAWSICGAGALVLAARRGPGGRAPGVRSVQVVLCAVAAAYAAAVVAHGSECPPEALLPKTMLACFSITLALAAGPLVAAALVLRGSFPSIPAWRGAAFGSICGLCGAVGIHLHCPVDGAAHTLPAHALPIAVVAAIGATLGALRGSL